MPNLPRGLIIAAPASGSGKTTITLGLLRRLAQQDVPVASFKVGPDYIDPAFHAAASGQPCRNLDLWAMRPATIGSILRQAAAEQPEIVIAEGVMGLFDGAADGRGSTADLAAATGWPVVLVVDVRGQAASAAALVAGFARYRADVRVAGVIFNRVGGDKHRDMLQAAVTPLGIPVLGYVPRNGALSLPDRHLGLVQAVEHADLPGFLDRAAEAVGSHVDLLALRRLAEPGRWASGPDEGAGLAPPGQRIAVADDQAFAFFYPHLADAWRRAGAELHPFSPLADEAPVTDADVVYLPGGYPELHAGPLAAAQRFMSGLEAARDRGATIVGECGGYMVLGHGLVDADGRHHPMAGLLPIETSFADRKLHLGYRRARLAADGPYGSAGSWLAAHEFHYARQIAADGADTAAPLFDSVTDAQDRESGPVGAAVGRVVGSFLHLIDRL